MALATRCPACTTVFRISTAQAAAKGGMVRCGQCRNVFNSLDALVRVEDLDVIEEAVVEPARPPAVAPPGAQDPIAKTRSEEAGNLETIADATDAPSPVEPAPHQSAALQEWWLPDPLPAAEARVEEPEADAAVDTRDDAGQLLSGRRTDLQWPAADLESTRPSFMHAEAPPTHAHRMARWLLGALTLVALAGLFAQAAYLWRDELAARWPPARSWLATACRALQCKVDYPAHLDAITIESASIKTTGPNLSVYELTALLRNRDSIEIRYPSLELVLTDLQDRPILRRVLRPEDYLPPRRDAGRAVQPGFAAESELPIHLIFELSDLRFAGFRVERFYP